MTEVPKKPDGSTDYPALLRLTADHPDLRDVPEAQANLRHAAKEMGDYEAARDYFGTSASYVKRLFPLDYCDDLLDDKPCTKEDCRGWQHCSIGKVVELVMAALHKDITDGSVRHVSPLETFEGSTPFGRQAGFNQGPPEGVNLPRPDGYREEPFIDLSPP